MCFSSSAVGAAFFHSGTTSPDARFGVLGLTKLAQWTQALLEQSDFRYENTLLRYVYLLQAKTHGWISMDGALRLSALRESFAKAHQGLDSLSGMEFLKGVTDVNGGFLGLLLREYPGSRHPVKHIFLMGHLFAEPDEFFARYNEAKLIADSEGVEALDKTLTDIRTQLREMVGVEGKSVNAVCKELGIPPTQGIRQLRKEGIPYKRRPRVLTPDSKQKLDGLLKAGAERNQIATSLGIRTAFIKGYLAEHPEIRVAWVGTRQAPELITPTTACSSTCPCLAGFLISAQTFP